MTIRRRGPPTGGSVRQPATVRSPAVAGGFYPGSRHGLEAIVGDLLADAARLPGMAAWAGLPLPAGLLVPHAGLVYSGVVAAAAWSGLAATAAGSRLVGSTAAPAGTAGRPPAPPITVLLLGTNHRAAWLDGIGAWDAGTWRTPLGDVPVDEVVAAAIVELGPPFLADRDAHDDEHSIEVQLPLLQAVAPSARIVPLAVAAGTGSQAVDAGRRLGELLARLRTAGTSIVVAISTDLAHYPPAAAAEEVTEALLPSILALDAAGLAAREAAVRQARIPGLVCGMCGIEPAVLGLAALCAMGATSATFLAASTSADAGGPADRSVGYLAVRFDVRSVHG